VTITDYVLGFVLFMLFCGMAGVVAWGIRFARKNGPKEVRKVGKPSKGTPADKRLKENKVPPPSKRR
jgi:hypothetical protein